MFDTEEEVRAINDSFDVADMWIGCSNREMDGTHYVCRWTNMTILPGRSSLFQRRREPGGDEQSQKWLFFFLNK